MERHGEQDIVVCMESKIHRIYILDSKIYYIMDSKIY
jgi:hypothetical protein